MSKGSEVEALLNKHGLQARRVKLYLLSLDSTRTPCTHWDGAVEPNSTQMIELLEQIEETALRRANVMGGSHAFCLEVLGEDEVTLATEFFRVSAEAMPNGAIASEPANEGGAFAQHMRHNEALFRLAMSGAQRAENTLTRQNETLARTNLALYEKLFSQMELVHTALTSDREHELAILKQTSRNKLTGIITDQVTNLLPEVASSLVAKKASSPALAAAVGMKGLIATLKPDQLAKVAACLEPEQQIVLFSAIKHLAAAEEAKNGPPPQPAQAANGAGGTNGAKTH